ncbi:hypothetical protein CRUP_011401 [Coryphaenoides rupestris]|nr:hypothetical protein CRUP_011401 [Coryphaenoides rupestris]
METKALWHRWVSPDRKVMLVTPGYQGNPVLAASEERRDHPGSKETEGSAELQESKATEAKRDKEATLVYQDFRDKTDTRDLKGQWVFLDMTVPKDPQVWKDLPALLGTGDRQGHPESPETQAPRDSRDHQESQGIQDNPEQRVKPVIQEESSTPPAPTPWASPDPQDPQDLPGLPDIPDSQVPLALLAFLAQLVLGGTRETQGYQ